jgi:hypothetical protein
MEPSQIKLNESKTSILSQSSSRKPLYVKVKNRKQTFMIFTDEYKKSGEIKNEISTITGIPVTDIKLYFNNKRLIEDDSTNHDQQIRHTTLLYVAFKNPENNEWDTINELINYKPEN